MLVALDEVDRQVEADAVKPGEEFGVEAEGVDAFVGLLEGLHGQVPGVGLVVGHVVEHAQEPGLVAADKLVEGSGVAGLRALDEHAVAVLLTVRFRGIGRFHSPPLLTQSIGERGGGKSGNHARAGEKSKTVRWGGRAAGCPPTPSTEFRAWRSDRGGRRPVRNFRTGRRPGDWRGGRGGGSGIPGRGGRASGFCPCGRCPCACP